ncbi:MAG: choice-of-anchor J domain-containing protein [candidate division KSB1 bacterium]|nr:choice-of-anchor J domain-containing protein [candidate division KSB1 bacterium]
MILRKLQITFRLAIIVWLIHGLGWLNPGYGQQMPEQTTRQALAGKNERLALPSHMHKLSSHLYDVLTAINTLGLSRQTLAQQRIVADFSTPLLEVDARGRCHLTLRTTEITPSLLSTLAGLEFEIEATTQHLPIAPHLHAITGWLPYDRIIEVARLTPIFHIRPTDKPEILTGAVTTEGDGILWADQARTSFGVSGAGQKIGVISDACTHLSNAQASGDLPTSVDIIKHRFSGDEGTAMMEIIHDIAPAAALAFADYGNDQADFANNILLLKKAGCSIICDDVLYHLEPVYEDGIIAQIVDSIVKDSNVVYISAAGNLQQDHHEGDFVDTDDDGWYNFASDDETMDIQLNSKAKIIAVLQWNNRFGQSHDDYDLYLYNEQLTIDLASSITFQDGNDDPTEILSYTNSKTATVKVHLCVRKNSGAARNLSIYTFGTGVTPTQYVGQGGAIYGHAGANRCLTVGAIYAKDPGNDDIEYYSSQGPVRIYAYDLQGNPLTSQERNKPDHAAIDGVQTKVGQLGYFSNPFFGTSAAAPHAAGIAALVREADASLNAINVGELLNSTAIDLGLVGYDYAFGFGRLNTYHAISAALVPPPTITVAPDSFSVSLFRGESATRIMSISNAGGKTLSYSLSWQPNSQTWNLIANSQKRKIPIEPTQAKTMLQPRPIPSLTPAHNAQRQIHPESTSTDWRSHHSAISASEILLFESFEAGLMPPRGWTKIDGNSKPGSTNPAHWTIDSLTYLFSGNYSASCYWGYDLNEWLITPDLDFSTVASPALSFWWLSSYYWHVDPNDNGDLFVKVSTDGGTTWKSLWTFGDIGVWEDFTWYYTVIDLSAYRGWPRVRIAFQVLASNNADIAVDDIAVVGESVAPWVQLSPTAGELAPANHQDVQVSFNTIVAGDTLVAGTYYGNVLIASNDPSRPTTILPVTMQVKNRFSNISGRLKYFSNSAAAVPNVTVQLDGSASQRIITDNNGGYAFSHLAIGDYRVTPKHQGHTKNAISPYDASLILRHVAASLTLSPYQMIAADVNGNGEVSSMDAALILQYFVGLINEFPSNREWTFLPHDYPLDRNNWASAPLSRTFSPLQADQANQDFVGILTGDVSGNWAILPGQGSSRLAAYFHPFQPTADDRVKLSIDLEIADEAFGGNFKLVLNNPSLKFQGCRIVQPSQAGLIQAATTSQQEVRVAFAVSQTLINKSITFEFIFNQQVPSNPSAADVTLAEVMIDDQPHTITAIERTWEQDLPRNWKLLQNYPNPFNSQTIISYEVPKTAAVRIEVFNLMGQLLRTLVGEIKKPGHYRIQWDGLDDQGRHVGSGIFIYKMKAGDFEASRKMVLAR